MGFHQTPAAERIHIGIFGRRNAGKSSIFNAVTGQKAAIVSEHRGTTTDPVYKAMELPPLGPVILIDTPGLDDEGELGELRVRKSLEVLRKTHLALLVVDAGSGMGPEDRQIEKEFQKRKLPYLIVYNKCDLWERTAKKDIPKGVLAVSARTGEGIWELKEQAAGLFLPENQGKRLVGDLLGPMDFVVLVVPIDKAAPKGRLILPQQQTIRDILEAGAVPVVTRDTELSQTLEKLAGKPRLVITDSQVFEAVHRQVPRDIPLTSFSILFARYKGNLAQTEAGAKALESLRDRDRVLISEGCTHHRQCGDIGTEKLPGWIREYTGKDLEFSFTSGTEFEEHLTKYRLVVHCGGCMLNDREMQFRLAQARAMGVPMTNYGMLIAYMKGILERSMEPLREARKEERNYAGKEQAGEEEAESLCRKLKEYQASDFYGFHMPGHKRQKELFSHPYRMDITEIEGFDDLHHPQKGGVLGKAQERAARLYRAEETHFLVNGSTAGILSAVFGCTSQGGTLLMARNCHRSAYHAAELRGLRAVYLYPPQIENLWINGGIFPGDVEKALAADPEIQAVLVTSPTYEGVCSDIGAIARICHRYGRPLLVDQAHGAHFPFSSYFPEDALKAGADVVIHSVHKTLPSLTQTALLHVQGGLADRERIRRYLSVYQSSSPSYVLMASLDSCMELLEREGSALFETHVRRLEAFRQGCRGLSRLFLVGKELAGKDGVWDFDRSKLLVSTWRAESSGGGLAELLRKRYHLEMEMAAPYYVLGITGAADTEEGFKRLGKALEELDGEFSPGVRVWPWAREKDGKSGAAVYAAGTAIELPRELVELSRCAGRIAASYLYLYPPGIPFLVPGEEIHSRDWEQMEGFLEAGLPVRGLGPDGRIAVLK